MSTRNRQPKPVSMRWWRMLGVAALGLSLSACGHSMSDLEQWVAKEKAQPGGRVPPIPQVTPYQSYAYPGHTRDPFDSNVLQRLYNLAHKSNVKIDPNRPRQYLEQFPLDSLKMVGTLTDKGVTYGLIQTPDGTIQRVTVGQYMGQHSGKITEVLPTSIKLREIVPDNFGGYKDQSTSIAMSKEK
ncbi:pilus assembly protein PilP [Acidihalobacter prosperus]